MSFKIISEFKKKSTSFKIAAAIAAVVIIVLLFAVYILNPNIPAENISFDNTHIYLQKGMTYTLTPDITPYNTTTKNLVYKCSDESIIKFDKNVIIPSEEGIVSVYCYDKKNNTKSNVITVEIVEDIAALIPENKKRDEDEEMIIENSAEEAQYVYYTDNGGKYHTQDCSYVSKNSRKGLLYNVQASGRVPCSKCNP